VTELKLGNLGIVRDVSRSVPELFLVQVDQERADRVSSELPREEHRTSILGLQRRNNRLPVEDDKGIEGAAWRCQPVRQIQTRAKEPQTPAKRNAPKRPLKHPTARRSCSSRAQARSSRNNGMRLLH